MAFACAMEFLFEPREEIKTEHANTIAALQDADTLKIGIQVGSTLKPSKGAERVQAVCTPSRIRAAWCRHASYLDGSLLLGIAARLRARPACHKNQMGGCCTTFGRRVSDELKRWRGVWLHQLPS